MKALEATVECCTVMADLGGSWLEVVSDVNCFCKVRPPIDLLFCSYEGFIIREWALAVIGRFVGELDFFL